MRFVFSMMTVCSLFAADSPKILIFYSQAGGGHKATAQSLQEEFQEKGACVKLVDAKAVLGTPIESTSFHLLETAYTKNLSSPFGRRLNNFFGSYLINPITDVLNGVGRLQMRREGKSHPLITFLEKERPDVVISTASFINRHLNHAISQTDNPPLFAVVMSDFDEVHRVMWSDAGPNAHYFVRKGAKLCQSIAADHLHDLPGMCLRRQFQFRPKEDSSLIKELELSADKTTLLFCFGGIGSNEMLDFLPFLQSHPNLQAIFLTGNHTQLHTEIKAKLPVNGRVVGYTSSLSDYMQISDLLVGKPGPGVVSEAVAMHLPMALKTGSDLMPQEKSVLNWVLEKEVASSWETNDEFVKEFPQKIRALSLMRERLSQEESASSTAQVVAEILKMSDDF